MGKDKKYNDLMEATGEPEVIVLQGEEYKIYPPTIEDMAMLFSFMKTNQKKEREELLQSYLKAAKQAEINPLDQIATIDVLVHEIAINTTDLLSYMDEVENVQFLLWLCIKKDKSKNKVTREEVGKLALTTQLANIKELLVKLMFGSQILEQQEEIKINDTEGKEENKNPTKQSKTG